MSRRITYAEKRVIEEDFYNQTVPDENEPGLYYWQEGWNMERFVKESPVPGINAGHVERLLKDLAIELKDEPDLRIGHVKRLEELEARVTALEAARGK